MKRIGIALALGLGAAVSVPAYAVTTIVGPSNTPATPAFQSISYSEDFEDGIFNGATASNVKAGSNGTNWAQPANDPTNFMVVSPAAAATSPVTLAISGFNQLSLYWGSLDSYNTLTFLGLGTSFTGESFKSVPGSTDGLESRQVTFNFTPEEAALITGVQFASTEKAFEFDNLSIGTAVPEPSVWAMMIFGFGLVGTALRRRAGSFGKAFASV